MQGCVCRHCPLSAVPGQEAGCREGSAEGVGDRQPRSASGGAAHAVSSLSQVYFRLHASILKLLGRPDSGVSAEVLVSFMKEAAEGPFARGEEKNAPKASEK